MKLEDVKEKIDAYFSNVSPEKVVEMFESLGYNFVPLDEEYVDEEYEVRISEVSPEGVATFSGSIDLIGELSFKSIVGLSFEAGEFSEDDGTALAA